MNYLDLYLPVKMRQQLFFYNTLIGLIHFRDSRKAKWIHTALCFEEEFDERLESDILSLKFFGIDALLLIQAIEVK